MSHFQAWFALGMGGVAVGIMEINSQLIEAWFFLLKISWTYQKYVPTDYYN